MSLKNIIFLIISYNNIETNKKIAFYLNEYLESFDELKFFFLK